MRCYFSVVFLVVPPPSKSNLFKCKCTTHPRSTRHRLPPYPCHLRVLPDRGRAMLLDVRSCYVDVGRRPITAAYALTYFVTVAVIIDGSIKIVG
jgi:hypothetical protein